MTDSSIPDTFASHYADGLQMSTGKTRKAISREARDYAGQMCPEGEAALIAWSMCGGLGGKQPGRSPVSHMERMGQRIGAAMGKVAVRFWRESDVPNRSNGHPRVINPLGKYTTIAAAYMAWIADNDYVPDDVTIAHFAGCTRSNIAGIRRRSADQGYELFAHECGWYVAKRPAPVVGVVPVVHELPPWAAPELRSTLNGGTMPANTPADDKAAKIAQIAKLLAEIL